MDILQKLKNDNEYYNGVGKEYLSNSDICDLLHNPLNFRQPKPDNKNFLYGRFFHQLLLEPHKCEGWQFVVANSRNTKLYKEKIEESGVDVLLLDKERVEIQELKDVMLRNFDFAMDLYKEGNVYEQPAIQKIKGVMWKGKADIITPDKVIDIKTTADISRFKWSARSYNYDSQAYLYQQLFGRPLEFYVIDKGTKVLGKFIPTPDFIEYGEYKVEQAVKQYNTYFAEGSIEDVKNFYLKEEL